MMMMIMMMTMMMMRMMMMMMIMMATKTPPHFASRYQLTSCSKASARTLRYCDTGGCTAVTIISITISTLQLHYCQHYAALPSYTHTGKDSAHLPYPAIP